MQHGKHQSATAVVAKVPGGKHPGVGRPHVKLSKRQKIERAYHQYGFPLGFLALPVV